MKAPKYKPYTGGAGPTIDQAWDNDLVLIDLLKKNGLSASYIKDPDEDDEEDALHIIVLKIHGKRYTCSYDRWGFHCDQLFPAFDQVSLGHALGFFIDLRNKEDAPAEKLTPVRRLAWIARIADGE